MKLVVSQEISEFDDKLKHLNMYLNAQTFQNVRQKIKKKKIGRQNTAEHPWQTLQLRDVLK